LELVPKMCHGPQGCTVALGVKVKVKVTRWAGTENLLARCTLGLVTDVYLDPGVYRGSGVKVKVKVTCWNS